MLLFGVSIYGIVVFFQRAMWEEMFLTTHFNFLQYGESIIKFLFDYICVTCLFGALGYYSNKGLILVTKRIKNKKKVHYGTQRKFNTILDRTRPNEK